MCVRSAWGQRFLFSPARLHSPASVCFRGRGGKLVAGLPVLFNGRGLGSADLTPAGLQTEQSNTVVAYGETFILKTLLQVAAGMHPDLEARCFLTEKASFTHTPAVAGL